MFHLAKLSATQITSYLLVIFSVAILMLSVYMTLRIDVIEQWRLILPKQKIHVNDEITIESTYVKKMTVSGTAVRYLDCKNKQDILIRYELNRRVADRAARSGGTGIVVKMPDTVADLPAKCRVAVVIDYKIFGPKHVIETNETDEFILYPAETTSPEETVSALPESDDEQRTSQTPVQLEGHESLNRISSSSNNSPTDTASQSDNSQKPDNSFLPIRLPAVDLNKIIGGLMQ